MLLFAKWKVAQNCYCYRKMIPNTPTNLPKSSFESVQLESCRNLIIRLTSTP